jgi:hypothetical protein
MSTSKYTMPLFLMPLAVAKGVNVNNNRFASKKHLRYGNFATTLPYQIRKGTDN